MTWDKGKNGALGILESQPVMGKKLPTASLRGWLPNGRSLNSINVKRANRFLSGQAKRIGKMVQKDKTKALQLGRALAKRSLTFQMCMFVRTFPRGYRELTYAEAKWIFKELRKDMLKGIGRIEINRFYLKKPTMEFVNDIKKFYEQNPEGKLRPIGAPKGPSRVKATMAMDVLFLMGLETTHGQHAYFPNKGVHTAICDLWDKGKKGYKGGIEIDLKSFFNTVDMYALERKFKGTDFEQVGIKVILPMIFAPKYGFKELDPKDKELKVMEIENVPQSQMDFFPIIHQYRHQHSAINQRGLVNSLQARIPTELMRFRLESHRGLEIMRFGLPQGLAISAALSVHYLGKLAMDNRPEVVMYSDDGILLWRTEDEGDYKKGEYNLRQGGILVADEKVKVMDPERVEFLGTTINLVKGTYKIENREYSLEKTFVNPQYYTKDKVHGDFDILDKSGSTLNPPCNRGGNKWLFEAMIVRIMYYLGLRQHPMTKNGYIFFYESLILRDVFAESTRGTESMLIEMKRWARNYTRFISRSTGK